MNAVWVSVCSLVSGVAQTFSFRRTKGAPLVKKDALFRALGYAHFPVARAIFDLRIWTAFGWALIINFTPLILQLADNHFYADMNSAILLLEPITSLEFCSDVLDLVCYYYGFGRNGCNTCCTQIR
jgi:hypothetical protein